MPQIILSLTQRLAWWTVTSRVLRFAKAHPAIVASLIIVAVLFIHPSPIWVGFALVLLNFNFRPIIRAIWYVEIIGRYLIVCNPARFSKDVIEDAIMTLMLPDVAKALSAIYGPKQVLTDIIAAEAVIHGPKPADVVAA